MKRKALVLTIFLMFVVGSLVVVGINLQKRDEVIDTAIASTKLIQSCQDVVVKQDVPVMGNCSYQTGSIVCNNITGACANQTRTELRECVVGTTSVDSIVKQCEPEKGFLINDVVRLSTQDYTCSTTEENEHITVICDSKYDGNGDGKCTSGESCQEFMIYGESVISLEKNSKDEFEVKDKSYFLAKASAEVLQ